MGLGKTYSTQYLADSNNNTGVAGQVLISTADGINWSDGTGIIGGPYLPLSAGASYPLTGNLYLESSNTDVVMSGNTSGNFTIDNNTGNIAFNANGSSVQSMNITSSLITINEPTNFTNGNVGIGTTNPAHKLTVNAANNTTAVGIDFPSAHFDFSANSTSGYNASFHMDNVGMDIGHDSTARSLNLITGNVDRLVILGNGNVGIGTTSPGTKLDVDGTSLFRRDLTIYHKGNNSAPSYELRFKGTNSSGVDKVHASLESSPYTTDTNAGTLLFKTANASNQILDTRMVIDGVGNVGIGTTNPLDPLNVQSTGASDYAFRIFRSTSTTQGLAGFYEGSANQGQLYLLKGDNTAGVFLNSNGNSYLNGGNVGIGTTSPGYTLDVNGSLHSTSLHIADGIYHEGDTNTYMQFHANDQWGVVTGNSEGLEVTNNQVLVNRPDFKIQNSGDRMMYVDSVNGTFLLGDVDGLDSENFITTENGRIDLVVGGAETLSVDPASSGRVGIGTTSPGTKLDVVGISRFTHSSSTSYRGAIETITDNAYPTWDIGWLHARTSSSNYGNVARFNDQSGFQIGAITYNGSAGVSYATTSDYRLKENIEKISDSISRVKKLKPCRFNFIEEKNRIVDGFIAHEVQKVVPEAVHGEKDALQEDGSIDAQTLEVSRLIPVLTKALQEAIAKIEELELRVQTLENK